MIFGYETDSGRIVRRYWGDETPDWYQDPQDGRDVAQIPDDEFPTPNRLDKDNVADDVLDRIRDKFPAERTPHDSVPWADDGLKDNETRVPVYYWDADNEQVRLETEIREIPDEEIE